MYILGFLNTARSTGNLTVIDGPRLSSKHGKQNLSGDQTNTVLIKILMLNGDKDCNKIIN